ncbi:MAG TPA: Rieske 2Fe-2S domain-containing protein [Burkholderiales bacterium]|nr:Rieske 2Fe-2S domain-containing protein [Burkholderiales bacterium]
MANPAWHRAMEADALPAHNMRSITIAYRDIALARVGDRLYAFGALCPHAAAPLHRHGELDGCMLTCTHHSWRFDLAQGGCEIYGNRGLTMYPVKEEDGTIYVRA